MPCYTVTLTSVDLNVADKVLLEAAIKSLGLHAVTNNGITTIQTQAGPITIRDGKAEFYNAGCQTWVNKIKQAYSVKTVEKVAKKFKFNITAKPGNKMILRRY